MKETIAFISTKHNAIKRFFIDFICSIFCTFFQGGTHNHRLSSSALPETKSIIYQLFVFESDVVSDAILKRIYKLLYFHTSMLDRSFNTTKWIIISEIVLVPIMHLKTSKYRPQLLISWLVFPSGNVLSA